MNLSELHVPIIAPDIAQCHMKYDACCQNSVSSETHDDQGHHSGHYVDLNLGVSGPI